MASGLEIKIRKGLNLDEVAFEAESNVELLYDCYLMSNNGNLIRAGIKSRDQLFLLMPVLAQTLFPFVRGHLMSFSFLPAGHNMLFFNKLLNFYSAFYFVHKCLRWLECRNIVRWNNDGCVPGDVSSGLFSPFLDRKATKSPQVHVLPV